MSGPFPGKPQLLAPAGDPEALLAAVGAGADAVYLGGRRFSARQSAGNFGVREIQQALRMAHGHGVQVLVAVNTLLGEDEWPRAAGWLHQLARLGVDGVIVQDPGLMALSRAISPDLPVHVSTQATVHNLAGALFWQRHGASRIILARELSLDDIALLARDSGMEVEVFVHGALCLGFSGQCLFSSLIWGRSGNRGRCAQPCRLEYSLDSPALGQSGSRSRGYLLSPRDLMLLEDLPRLARAGVRAFKIEGRMKRPEYVGVVTAIYRQALDRWWADPVGYEVTEPEKADLAQVFNRGFTRGYLSGAPDPGLINRRRPNHRGLALGRVQKAGGARVGVILGRELAAGDEIEFWVSRGGRRTLEVSDIQVEGQQVTAAAAGQEVSLPQPGGVKAGDRVFCIRSRRLEEWSRELAARASSAREPLWMRLEARIGQPLSLKVWDARGNRAQAQGERELDRAHSRPARIRDIEEKLGRLGDTPFGLRELEANVEPEVMIPFSELNQLRRRALEKLQERCQEAARPALRVRRLPREALAAVRPPALGESRRPAVPRLEIRVSTMPAARAALQAGADAVALCLDGFGGQVPWAREDWEALLGEARGHGSRLLLGGPRILMPEAEDGFARTLARAREAGLRRVLATNWGVLELARRQSWRVTGDYFLNVFSSPGAALLLADGLEQVTLSPELDLERLQATWARVEAGRIQVLVGGRLPLLVSAACPLDQDTCRPRELEEGSALEDRKGEHLPLAVDDRDRMHLFNARELWGGEALPVLASAGVGSLGLEARARGAGAVAGLVRHWRFLVDSWQQGEYSREEARARAQELYPQGWTRGHLWRPVG